MKLWTKSLITLAFLGGVTAHSLAAQNTRPENEAARRFRYIMVETVDGAQLPASTVAFVNGKGSMLKGEEMPDGSCMVWERNSKLTLEVALAGHEPSTLELDLRGVDRDMLRVIADETTGEIRFAPVLTRELVDLGYGNDPNERPTQISFNHNDPPANDDCVNAQVISGNGAWEYDTRNASSDGIGSDCFAFTSAVSRDVWFCWTAPCTGYAKIDTCFGIGDSRVAVYDGCACPGGGDDPIACSDGGCGPLGLMGEVTIPVVQGQEYLIQVGNFPHLLLLVPAKGYLNIECIEPPANDDCENAEVLYSLPADVMGSSNLSTDDGDLPYCDGVYVTGPGVWYEVVGTGYTMEARTCSLYTNFDTKLSIFCRDCGPDLTCVKARDNGCGPFSHASKVRWCSQEGAVYRIFVHGFAGATGDFRLRVRDVGTECDLKVRCRFKGACCIGDTCHVKYDDDCENEGGTFYGDLTDCCGKGIYDGDYCAESFEDISMTGQDLNLEEDGGETIPIGFGFDFFGHQHFYAGVSANGYVAFGEQYLGAWYPFPVPSQSGPDNLAAPFWADWSPQNGGGVQYQTLGDPGHRRLIVQWTNVPHYNLGGSNTFQVVFYEGTNEIKFKFGSLENYMEYFPSSRGIENKYGTHGYPMSSVGASGPCVCFTPRWAPICDGAEPLVLDEIYKFSELDGSVYDLDGLVNGSLKANGLTVNSWLKIDVECAEFDIQGDLIVNGSIFQDHSVPFPYEGPEIKFKVCENVYLNQGSVIRALGGVCGGKVSIFAGGNFKTTSVAGIEAKATSTYGSKGGWIDITTRGKIDIGYQGFLNVKGEKAGHIELISCSGHYEAIKNRGVLIASGWGPNGCGGEIKCYARQGGIITYGHESMLAPGQYENGSIYLKAALTVGPIVGLNTNPWPYIEEYCLDYEPCICIPEPHEDEGPILVDDE